MNNNFIITIPARFKSSRLPGKPLKDICGKAMIHHVWDICINAVSRKKVVVLTDDYRIKNYCIKNDINYSMTSSKCKTGTDRIYEYAKENKYNYYINVQGDEPLIDPKHILDVLKFTINQKTITNCYSMCSKKEYLSKNIPKVVVSDNKDLLYMSRAPIPACKNNQIPKKFYKQICIYGFPRKSLLKFGKYDKKSSNENYEDIEIIRFLDLGMKVKMIEIEKTSSIAVDTLVDLRKVRKIFENKHKKN